MCSSLTRCIAGVEQKEKKSDAKYSSTHWSRVKRSDLLIHVKFLFSNESRVLILFAYTHRLILPFCTFVRKRQRRQQLLSSTYTVYCTTTTYRYYIYTFAAKAIHLAIARRLHITCISPKKVYISQSTANLCPVFRRNSTTIQLLICQKKSWQS